VAEDKFGFQGGKAANRTVGYLSVFSSVVVGTFQIIFHTKIHVIDVFLFFKNYF